MNKQMCSYFLSFIVFVLVPGALFAADVLTERNNNERTGAVEDTAFDAAAFASGWGKLGELPVDGRVYAQPLYVEGVQTPSGMRNVVYVATAANRVYAFDARTLARVWGPVNLGPHDQSNIGDPRLGCDWISPDGIGTEATPVIDRSNSRIYVSYRVNNSAGGKDPLT